MTKKNTASAIASSATNPVASFFIPRHLLGLRSADMLPGRRSGSLAEAGDRKVSRDSIRTLYDSAWLKRYSTQVRAARLLAATGHQRNPSGGQQPAPCKDRM